MASSDEESEILPQRVSNYYFETNNDKLVCFSVLPIQWDNELPIDEAKIDMDVFLRGKFDGGLQNFHKKVIAWKFDLSYLQPKIFVLTKKKHWIELQKPLKKLEYVYRKVFVAIHWMHFVKENPSVSSDVVWNHLSKTFCAYDVGPSKKDLLDYLSLISETARRVKELQMSMHFRTFSVNSSAEIAFEEDVPQRKKSNFISNEDEIEAGVDVHDCDKADDIFDTVCAICDEGGQMLCCTGMCLRSFHPTIADGVESQCRTLGFQSMDEVDAIDNFLCQNCLYKQHQCFACGRLGSSYRSSSQEVFRCVSAFCGRFYHPGCVAKLLYFGNETQAEELEQKISEGESFACPSHKCFICKQAEDKDKYELQFAVCRRCPRVFHRKCLPKNIIFTPDATNPQRAWEGLLPNNRILIYCMRHKINRFLKTPVRDHLIFPIYKNEMKKCTEEHKSSQWKISALSKRSMVSESFPVRKPEVKKLKIVTKPSNFVEMRDSTAGNDNIFHKLCYELPKRSNISDVGRTSMWENSASSSIRIAKIKNKLLPVGKSVSYSSKPKQQNIAGGKTKNTVSSKYLTKEANVARPLPVNNDIKQRIEALVDKVHSSFDIEEFNKRWHVQLKSGQSRDALKSVTVGLVEGSVRAVQTASKMLEGKASREDIETICGPEILKKIFTWRRMLKIYLAPFLHGNRYTSLGRHFTQTEKLKQIVNRLHHYVLDGDMVVDFCCGSNDFSCLMKEKLEETGKSCSYKNYDLLPAKNDFCFEKRDWMTVGLNELPDGLQLSMGLNPPFGTNASLANAFIKKALEFRPKLLILIVPKETIRVDKRAAYDLIWEDEVLLEGNAFYLPGSVDVNNEHLNDWNINPPILSLWSRSDWTHKHMIIARKNDHVPDAQHNISNLARGYGYNNFYGNMHVGGSMSIGFDSHGWQNTGNPHVDGGMSSRFEGRDRLSSSNLDVGGGMFNRFDRYSWQNTEHLFDGMSSGFDSRSCQNRGHLDGSGMASIFDRQGWQNTGNSNFGCGMPSGFDGHARFSSVFSNHVACEDRERLSGGLNETPNCQRNQNESLAMENKGIPFGAKDDDVCIDMEIESSTHEIGNQLGKD